jgi:glycine cleavage system H lipoate-binding protein
MVIALFILMVAVFLIAEYFFFSKKISPNTQAIQSVHHPINTSAIERYFHPGHSWVLVRSSEPVVVGVNDFSQRFIGRLDGIELPREGSFLRQGEAMVTFKHGDKSLTQVAPVSGVVVEVNAHLKSNPSIVNDSPLEEGWIAKISPRDLTLELRNLLRGVIADRWQESVRTLLVHWFSPQLGTVMQDGGGIVDNVSDLVDSKEWRLLVNDFFPHCSSTIHNNNS